ncbi:hypothetical protein [Streptomyces sp. NPDC050287]|uniref:hypothetical protein n=1 Tax=Streptomyces sp. NPDC050287 TaxID=3365608 RepID=UPI0037A29A7D
MAAPVRDPLELTAPGLHREVTGRRSRRQARSEEASRRRRRSRPSSPLGEVQRAADYVELVWWSQGSEQDRVALAQVHATAWSWRC